MSDFQTMVTKLLPPQIDVNLIERPRLLKLASQTPGWQFALLTAPAGYGKSVFMTQLVKTIPKPLVWYQLDEYDNDPAIFIQYLITAVRRHVPGFGMKVIPLIQQGDLFNKVRLITTLLINELNPIETGLGIALDDFQVITEPIIHRFIQELLNHLPENIYVTIASRNPLPFPIPRTFLFGRMVSMTARDLRFSGPEIASFIAQYSPQISQDESRALETKTNGWPAIFQFVATSSFESISAGNGDPIKTVYEFLASEVLDWQPEEIRSFLLKSSVLDVMTPQTCDRLLKRDDSAEILTLLEHRQLFLSQLAGVEPTYRYHQLFRDFLLDKLGMERTSLLNRAGSIALQMGETDRAVEYFLTVGNETDLYNILPETCTRMLQQGRWQTLSRWFETLPTQKITANPWLSLIMGRIEVYRGLLDQAAVWTERAVAGFAQDHHEKGLNECQILQAQICRRQGQYLQALGILDDLETALTPGELKQRIDLPMEKSLCLFMAGHFNTAKDFLQTIRSNAEAENNPNLAAHFLEALGNTEYFLGNYVKALQYYKRGAEISPGQILPSYYMQDSISTIYQDWGEFDQALEYATRNAAIKEKYGLTEALPSAYLQLASICVDQNGMKRAEEYFNRAINILRENNGEHFYLVLCLVFFSRCLGLQGRWVEARAKAEEALRETHHQPGLALAVCQVVGGPVFIETGNPAEGVQMLNDAVIALEPMGFQKALCHGYAHLAWYYFNEADDTTAGGYAVKALQIAARINFLQIFITYYDTLQSVLKFGLVNNLEVTFIQRILIRLGERSCGLIGNLAVDADPGVRGRIVLPLTEIGGSQATLIMSDLLSDHDPDVRKLAQRAAERLHLPLPIRPHPEKNTLTIHVKTFGSFWLNLNENSWVSAKWRTMKTRDLLAYLLHYGEAVSKDRILEDLWPQTHPRQAADLFHTTLSNLRQMLSRMIPTDLIVYNFKRYQLISEHFRSDRQLFQELLTEGSQPGLNPKEAMGCLEQAVLIYQVNYLEELDYVWLIPEREHLKRLYAETRLRLATYYFEQAEYSRAISNLQILTQLNPLDEDVHGLLMRAYSGTGNLAAVKEQYQTMVKTLNEELGLAPAANTVALYRRIIENRQPERR